MSEVTEIARVRIRDGRRILTTFRCFRDGASQWWEELPPQSARSRHRHGEVPTMFRIGGKDMLGATRWQSAEETTGRPPTRPVPPDGVRRFGSPGDRRGRVYDFGTFSVRWVKLRAVLDKFREAGLEDTDITFVRTAIDRSATLGD